MLEFDAVLEDWVYDPRYRCIWGFCYDDIKGRFRNGTWIHTSSIPNANPSEYVEGFVVQTLNTKYLLGTPQRDAPKS